MEINGAVLVTVGENPQIFNYQNAVDELFVGRVFTAKFGERGIYKIKGMEPPKEHEAEYRSASGNVYVKPTWLQLQRLGANIVLIKDGDEYFRLEKPAEGYEVGAEVEGYRITSIVYHWGTLTLECSDAEYFSPTILIVEKINTEN